MFFLKGKAENKDIQFFLRGKTRSLYLSAAERERGGHISTLTYAYDSRRKGK